MRKHLISFAQEIKILQNIKLKGVLTLNPNTPCVRPWYGQFTRFRNNYTNMSAVVSRNCDYRSLVSNQGCQILMDLECQTVYQNISNSFKKTNEPKRADGCRFELPEWAMAKCNVTMEPSPELLHKNKWIIANLRKYYFLLYFQVHIDQIRQIARQNAPASTDDKQAGKVLRV